MEKLNKWNMVLYCSPITRTYVKKMNKWNTGLTVRPSLSSFLGRTSVIVAELEGGQ